MRLSGARTCPDVRRTVSRCRGSRAPPARLAGAHHQRRAAGRLRIATGAPSGASWLARSTQEISAPIWPATGRTVIVGVSWTLDSGHAIPFRINSLSQLSERPVVPAGGGRSPTDPRPIRISSRPASPSRGRGRGADGRSASWKRAASRTGTPGTGPQPVAVAGSKSVS